MQKYLILNEKQVIIFDINIKHSEIASNQNITSAGFIDRDGNCFGYSDSLNISSKATDTEKVRKFLKLTIQKVF